MNIISVEDVEFWLTVSKDYDTTTTWLTKRIRLLGYQFENETFKRDQF